MISLVSLVAAALVAFPTTHAALLDCSRLLDSFDVRAAKMTEAENWRGPLGRQIFKVRRWRLALSALGLGFAPSNVEEKKRACDRVIAVAERDALMYSHSREVIRLFTRFCENDPAAIEKLTDLALDVVQKRGSVVYHRLTLPGRNITWAEPIRSNVKRWIDLTLEKNWLSRDQWSRLIGDRVDRALPVLDATHDDLTRLGFTREKILELTASFARTDVPFLSVASFSGLPREEWTRLEPLLDPVQWLGFRRATGTFDDSVLPQFEARAKNVVPAQGYRSDGAADRELLALLYDPSIPYALFQKVHDLASANWRAIYDTHFRLSFDPTDLTEAQLERAERYFGRATVRSDDVWRESRVFAKAKTAHLVRAKFASADEFVAAFKVANFYPVPREAYGDDASEDWYQTMAVAERYFKILHARLPEFFRLQPTAGHARWILETPLQFPRGLHDMVLHWGKSRLNPVRLVPWERGHYDIRRHIFAVMHETVEKMATSGRLRTIEDLFEITTFKNRGAAEYESIKRWAMNHLLDEAVRVGDPVLKWLDYPVHENDHELRFLGVANQLSWFNQLVNLRESIPADARTEASINARAVEWLVGMELYEKSNAVYTNHAGAALMRALTALVTEKADDGKPRVPDPELVRGGLVHLREGLLRFLSVRTQNGSPVSIMGNDFEALKQVASELKYDLHVVRQTANGAVVVKVRRSKN